MRICQNVIAVAMTIVIFLFAMEAASATTDIDFTRDVQPIFAKACWSCHGVDKQEAGCVSIVPIRPCLVGIPAKLFCLVTATKAD